ncbi:MAG TPA: hypothetical protein VJP02_17315 [Candidatus Sulfotelmatobacter sp.]|nr:hypothetical protein [Candidatus Sulfotelmatobacter sp.]
MQEVGPPMSLDPLSINYQLPWESRLLILYLLVVVAVSFVKSASMLRTLWLSKHSSLQQSSAEHEFMAAWERCSNKVQSIKRWVFVTLFWTVLVAATLLRNEFMYFTEQKIFWTGAFFVPTAEVLTTFALGMLVCAVLYTVCALFDGALLRKRESWNSARSGNENR